MILPKPHLSFSQITLWESSKESYRKKYYPKDTPPFPTSPAMAFGNEVTNAMEKKEDWVSFIPHLPVFEHRIYIDINGVMVLMYIDSSDLKTGQFMEQKTGVTPWIQNKVDKHFQFDIYSLGLQLQLGKVIDESSLIWVKTKKETKKKTIMMGGIELEGDDEEVISLTGEYEVIPRIITQANRDAASIRIGNVGREIEEDYAAMKHLYQ